MSTKKNIICSKDAKDYLNKEKPAETPQIGFYVYILCFVAVIGGFLFGYDSAVVSSAMLYIPDADGMKKLSVIWKQLIVSITPGLAAIGALLAAPSSDHFGRKKVIIFSSLVFTIGGIVCAVSPEKITLFFGRMLLGLAIGLSSVIVPVYVGETSPAYMRGFLLTAFQVMICFGEMSASLISGAFSYIDPEKVGWRLMMGFTSVPSFIQLVGFLFLPESPRYLFKKGQEILTKKAIFVLSKIYKNDLNWVEYEKAEIARVCQQELEAKATATNEIVIVRMLKTRHVRKALIIGCLLQMFQQLCGINAIMHEFFFLGTFVPLFLIDKFGRRLLLLISVAGVDVALFLTAVAFLLINRDSDLVNTEVASEYNITDSSCFGYSNCDYCVTDDNCGFCYLKDSDILGQCLPVNDDDSDLSTVGWCSTADTNFTFHNEYCTTKYTAMPIVAIIIYIFFFAIGFAPLAWALNAEFHPLWARSSGCALSTFTNWFFSLIISLTFLSLSTAITKYGVFFIYAGITFVAFFFVLKFIPETTGIGIEDVELLFMDETTRKKVIAEREKSNGEKEEETLEKKINHQKSISENSANIKY
ncbi:unnamed protein product [Enterobius vermicularis]|uniref:Major facilitator superfamily (MFS) profile domain-containing protein n=1 Tax=Enterobius vermicularis TaxID=51028 RepID=A0A3P6HF35_ENTVE|nr:unnamed protein product [Enterobius vermicularis]